MNDIALAPEFQPIIEAVVSGKSDHTKRLYRRDLGEFFKWYVETKQPTFNRATVQRYKEHLVGKGLSAQNINRQLSPIRTMAKEAALNGAMPENIANGIAAVDGVRQEGKRVGNWLTLEEAKNLLDAPDTSTLKGLRDRALLATLLGCGLRRNEAASLTFDHIQQRDGRWIIVDLVGKRNKVRSVPMASWTKQAIDEWAAAAGVEDGLVFRAVNKSNVVSGELSAQGIYMALQEYTSVAPHDMRRTFAKLARQGGAELTQIQLSLGHSNVRTTQDYVGEDQDLTNAPCDHIGLSL